MKFEDLKLNPIDILRLKLIDACQIYDSSTNPYVFEKFNTYQFRQFILFKGRKEWKDVENTIEHISNIKDFQKLKWKLPDIDQLNMIRDLYKFNLLDDSFKESRYDPCWFWSSNKKILCFNSGWTKSSSIQYCCYLILVGEKLDF